MLKNYFKIAFRNLIKNSTYSIINIFGLSVGIASSMLILLWVADEYSYDRFHANYDRIYQVYKKEKNTQSIITNSELQHPLKEAIENKSTAVKRVVMTNSSEGNLLQVGDKRLNKLGLSATEDFFKIFSFRLVKGDPNTVLTDPTSIVLTESTAKLFFGENDPINQLIKVDNGRELKVTGVVEDVAKQSTFNFDYVLPFAYYEATQRWVRTAIDNWNLTSFQLYVELQPNATPEQVTASIKDLVKDNNPNTPSASLFLHHISRWRLFSRFQDGENTGGSIEYVRLFTAIAILVLLIACINFMNLATARSESRAREVGIRKSVGSRRKELIFQFLGESIFVTFLSSVSALVLVELALPFYNQLVDKDISIDYLNPIAWIIAVAWIILIGVLSGSYPAFYLSAFRPVQVLKGKLTAGKGATTPRKILVTLQFGFSIFLIIGTVVIYQQIAHVKSRDLGYDKENLIQIWTNNELEENFQTVRTELEKTGVVKSVCKSNSPITEVFSQNEVAWEGMTEKRVMFSTIATEYDYIKTMGIDLLEGRDFSREFNDSSSIIVNQAAAEYMGYKDPIGRRIKMDGDDRTIIGVIPNVVMDSPYEPVKPTTVVFSPTWSSTVTIRLNKTNNLQESLDKIKRVFKRVNPTYPFESRFADNDFDRKFASINLISRLATIFAILAILITCLGLLGLAAFTAAQRTKEVGIRKVMGASVTSLVILLSGDFSRLVIFGFLISAPAAWLFLDNFLQRYPYRIEIAWWMFPVGGLGALFMALLIVSTQALKAALSNPANSLRSE